MKKVYILPIRVRIGAESDPFVTPTARVSIDLDTVDIAVANTFGTPDFDYWHGGAIPGADLTVTALGGGLWRVEGDGQAPNTSR